MGEIILENAGKGKTWREGYMDVWIWRCGYGEVKDVIVRPLHMERRQDRTGQGAGVGVETRERTYDGWSGVEDGFILGEGRVKVRVVVGGLLGTVELGGGWDGER